MPSSTDMGIKGSLISYFSNLIKKNGGTNLAQGIPGFQPPAKLLSILENTITQNCHQYAPGIGNLNLVDYLETKYQTKNNNSKVLVTNGATEAISLIYNYLMTIENKQEFKVAAFSPAYESYIHLPRIFGHEFFPYLVDDKIYFDETEFENFFTYNKIKLLFVSSPGNPFGKTMSKQQLNFLVQLAERNNAYVIIDAVYNELVFGDELPYYPLDNLSKNVFYVNSFSKKYSITGWRIGYFLMHQCHFESVCYIHDYIGLCASAPMQQALSEFVNCNESPEYISFLRSTIRENNQFVLDKLSCNGFYCPQTDGGYFVWCKLPEQFENSLKFGLELYDKTKTAIIPGVHFGREWNNYIRINIARERAELIEGIDSILSFIK